MYRFLGDSEGLFRVFCRCRRGVISSALIFLSNFVVLFSLGGWEAFSQDVHSKEIEHFESIVFDDYRLENGKNIIRKWKSPIIVSFLGDVEMEVLEGYTKSLDKIKDNIEHDLSYSNSYGNVRVFHYENVQEFIRREYESISYIYDYDYFSIDALVVRMISKNFDCWYGALVEENEIKAGLVFVSSKLKKDKKLKCFNVGLAEILGLMSGQKRNIDSIKNILIEYNFFSDMDVRVLQMLYKKGINIGDTKSESIKKIKSSYTGKMQN